jgi:hypothetical protein
MSLRVAQGFNNCLGFSEGSFNLCLQAGQFGMLQNASLSSVSRTRRP